LAALLLAGLKGATSFNLSYTLTNYVGQFQRGLKIATKTILVEQKCLQLALALKVLKLHVLYCRHLWRSVKMKSHLAFVHFSSCDQRLIDWASDALLHPDVQNSKNILDGFAIHDVNKSPSTSVVKLRCSLIKLRQVLSSNLAI